MEMRIRGFRVRRQSGEVLEIDEYQEFIDITAHGDVVRKYAPGLKRYQLKNGGAVNYVDDRTFVIVSTGETVTTG